MESKSLLKELLDTAGVTYIDIVESELAGQTILAIQADDADAHALIGAHGDVVHALDHLLRKIREQRMSVPDEDKNVHHPLVDVNDYRSKQIKDLQTKALMMAERARSFQYDVELSPMSAYERLIVHTTLADAPQVKTESEGEGRNRRVVIRYRA